MGFMKDILDRYWGRGNRKRYFGVVLQLLFVYLLLFTLLPWSSSISFLPEDSVQYLEVSQALEEPSRFKEQCALPYSLIVRAPGYPLLLSFTSVFADQVETGVLLLHLALALVSTTYFMYALRKDSPIGLSGLGAVTLFVLAREMSLAVVSEWPALCLILSLTGSWVLSLERKSRGSLLISSLLTSLLILVRPVFLPLIVVVVVLGLSAKKTNKRITYPFAIVVGGLPLLVLIGVHSIILGTANSPSGTISLFGVTSALGPVEVAAEDPPTVRAFIEYVNSNAIHLSMEDIDEIDGEDSGRAVMAVAGNAKMIDMARVHLNQCWKDVLGMARTFSLRSIKTHLGKYLFYVYRSILSLSLTIPYLPLSLILPLWGLKADVFRRPAIAVLLLLATHGMHLATVSFLGIVHSRYYKLTLTPVIAISLFYASLVLVTLCARIKRTSN